MNVVENAVMKVNKHIVETIADTDVDDNDYFDARYSVGATESQNESPWEYQEEVECIEVTPREMTRTEWVAVIST